MGNILSSNNENQFLNPVDLDFNKSLFWIITLTIFSGAIRKWVFTTGSMGNILLLIQLFLPFLISLKKLGFSLPSKLYIFKFYFLYLLISAFNPLNLTIFHGILGIILHLGFWWLIFFYYENRQLIDIRPLIPWMVTLCVIEFIIGIVQYQLPADSFLNKYAAIDQLGVNQSVAMVGNSVRITGTFSYISGYTSFLIFAILFIWSLFYTAYNKRVIVFLLLGVIITTLMSGSRTSTLIVILIILLIIISEFTLETISDFIKSMIVPFLILFIFFSAKLSSGGGDIIKNAFSNFETRRIENSQTGEQNQRIKSDIQELFMDYRGKYPFFGVGLGSTYQGATSIFGTSEYVFEYGYYEGELPRIVLEAGFILLIFRVLLFAWLFSWLEINILSKFVCFIIFGYATGIIFNIYSSIFLALGLIFLDNTALRKKIWK